MSIRYRVYITPLISNSEYGDETEVTDIVLESGVSTIKRSIDSTDYDFGAFYYDYVSLKCLNIDGQLNDESDVRSIFMHTRDRAKVRIVYTDAGEDTITFRGLINEEATRIDATKDEIEFRVLSRDSVIRNVGVAAGAVSAGTLISDAIFSILNQADISSVLTVAEANINVADDYEIDDPSGITDRSSREALNLLLLASNSVMIIDENDVVTVRSREENSGNILNLYGPYDLKRRQNIIDIKNYNLGRHRMFTAVKVNETEESNTGYQTQYGYRQKAISLEFITDSTTETLIAESLVDYFKAPKIELEVTVPTSVARDVSLLDTVSIDHPLRISPPAGTFLPIVGQAVIGDADTPLPNKFGSVSIPNQMGFKIIEIREDVRRFETTLKLRQIGTETGDGFFTSGVCGIIGYAVIGTAEICDTGDTCDTYNPSVIGGAVVGCTEVA